MSLYGWFRGASRLDELSDEIQSHIDEKTDELVARGISRAEAERAARRAFGDVTRVKEAAGDVWRFDSSLANLAADVRHALRGLINKPGYTIAVILTLALGIGANAVVFALVHAVVLRPLPYADPDRIISISQMGEGRDHGTLHDVVYADWLALTRSVESSAAYEITTPVLNTADGPRRVTGLLAMPTYFGIFGVRPILGHTFDESETQTGTANVVVLSEQLWRERFSADSAVLGRSASFDGVPRTVIGVLPAWFTQGREERFWIPLRFALRMNPPGDAGEVFAYSVVARLREGVSRAAVRAELAALLARTNDNVHGGTPVVMTLHERRQGDTRRPLLLLFGAVGLLLLTACANVANLALARAARREREFGLRLALGASRWRIVRFVLIESLALSAGGALLGMLLVSASVGWFVRISPGSIGSVDGIGVSGALIAYASAVALITALLFGLVPALTASRATLSKTLASGTLHSAGSKRQLHARRALVIGELAVALVFLTGAGLVARTFWRVASVDPGFRPEKLLVTNIELGDYRYSAATAEAFFDQLTARVRREPGVLSVTNVLGAPMTGGGGMSVEVVSSRRGPGTTPSTPKRFRLVGVDPEYLNTIGATMVAGRFITPDDRVGAPRVVVVSEDYVRLNLDGAPAIGRTVGRDQTIVGVMKDIAQEASDGPRYPLIFVPITQMKRERFGQIIVRTAGEPEQLQTPIRQAMQALDPAQPPPTFTTMQRALAEVVAPRWFILVLLACFAALAFTLAVIGLYSVLAYLVTERTREIGIRLAVGADRSRVLRMVLGHGLRLTIVGLILGGATSIAAVRVLRAWMYEMSVYDAPTFGAVAVLLCAVALIASWLPARRASRVDPMLALRAD
jgi:putative ABC transport system permease protein